MRPGEAGEGLGQPPLGDVLGNAEPQAGLGLVGAQALQQLIIQRQHAPSGGEHPLALGVELQAAAGLPEQRASALRLQPLQLQAHRRERPPHPARRAGEGAGLLHQGEGPQQLEIQGFHHGGGV